MPATDVHAELLAPLSPREALLEADACLECGGPYASTPCTEAVPAGVDVPGFVDADRVSLLRAVRIAATPPR